ncbi:MAG: Ig-like domain-containing protein [Candidatus Polarisedimenticolia bacterium]
MMTRLERHLNRTTAAAALVLALAGCQSSEVVAPEESEIQLSAIPAVIVLSGGIQVSPVDVTAFVTNKLGVPLPGQSVRFTTSIGSLTPPALTPIETDASGNATTVQTAATQDVTITAQSGTISEMLQIRTATCNLSTLTLNPSPILLETCNDTFTLTAEATDSGGDACASILVQFEQVATSTPMTDVSVGFNPASARTDAAGVLETTLSFSNASCNSLCVAKSCTGQVRARAGGTNSTIVTITDNVP